MKNRLEWTGAAKENAASGRAGREQEKDSMDSCREGTEMDAALQTEALAAGYGKRAVVKNAAILVRPGQIVLDVSVNWDAQKPNARGGLGAIAGDAVFSEVEPVVGAITPVPGGVGAVTASVLIGHVVEAAERTL